ncbi:MAG: metallophosphoesterase family protein [Atribacterota bacterium]|nr:metallophosphoesterase family protein [Atribacterota bacterium]MDD5637009.1 metallophosphoesterase family protein [Atribacterota bacterium]
MNILLFSRERGLSTLKMGIISDIHGNAEALNAVLNELKNVERIFCLGDIIGYGADPVYCIEKMRELDWLCLKGNHEGAITGELDLYYFNEDAKQSLQWTKKQLNEQNFNYLNGLRRRITIAKDILGVHGSPRQPLWEYILDKQTAEEIFIEFDFKVYFVGHSHVAGYFTFHRENKLVRYFDATVGAEIILENNHSYIINSGSIGQPRDGNPQASFIIFDTEKEMVFIRRVSYPISKAQAKIIKAGLPKFLAERLAIGI